MSRIKCKSPQVSVFCLRFSPKLRKDNPLVTEGVDMSRIKLQGFIEFLNGGFLPPHKISENARKEKSLNPLLSLCQKGTGFHEHVFLPEHPI